ncbi:family 2 glycosyl transferase [Gracilibacillus halophilus YIM-C55.5]|uniref:Family 2 glycosyl transferase n=1 Tax=Gracilibacillus halophilus YIM-C55.5 TaxID=1308866 RepID=N4WIX5_9BACI|nr:glycosyltransferase family 2 protein [Gracilibacillus halophilus]ENH96072.1 family 2 glycosyl transferase [Gracilibacillus halophilus YIM-C55.5]
MRKQRKKKPIYIPVQLKFWLSHGFAIGWMLFSIYLSFPWVQSLAEIFTFPIALFIIGGIAYVPGYLNAFLVITLILDRQPAFKQKWPDIPVSILIACRNEADTIANTLQYIKNQDYRSLIQVILIDNGSTDNTAEIALEAAQNLDMHIHVIHESKPGKFHALNRGIQEVTSDFLITLDADTLLHSKAVRYLVARIISAPTDVCAVAGSVLVRNSRYNLMTKIQEWDYFLGIASIKRLQGLYQGTLVAQGAFSIYKTEAVKDIDGWPDAIGEDIVLTWKFLRKGWKVFFEPLAVAFTDVPTSVGDFTKQRSRWARGMVEALKLSKPWEQPQIYTKYLTGINFIMPYMDVVYTFFWLPGLILSLFGYFWIVGPMTLFVLPLTFISYGILYRYQKSVFKELNLRVRKNMSGFILFTLCYQMLMAPVSVWGYVQETFKLKRKWK